MPVHNSDVTKTLNKLADLLEIRGANAFRVRAYREAARTVDGLPRNLGEMVANHEDLSELPDVGESIAKKIEEIVETGNLKQLEKLKTRVPDALADLLNVSGLGPKRVSAIHQQLGIENREDLRAAARAGRIRELKGFGPKTEHNILEDLEKRHNGKKRFHLAELEEIAEAFIEYLRSVSGVNRAVIAGSYRRRQESVGDLDILVSCGKGCQVADRFLEYDDVTEVISHGKKRLAVRLRSGMQVDLRVVPEASYGAALHYFTGSKAHNIAVRKMGVDRQLKINEYGVFRGDERVAGSTEEEVFEQVGLPYIEPELREDRGEIDAAKEGKLPALITRDDIRGDLHCHTKASDGKSTLEEMAQAAIDQGYEYLAVTEHSKRLTVARGLDEQRLRGQIQAIDKLNEKLNDLVLLKGIECDILEDGSLDLDDDVLAELDIVVCAIHSKFDLPIDQQTERVIRAMDNPHFNILAHPTGRMLGQRDAIELDMKRVMESALQRKCFLELNAQPDRLDLSDTYCRLAKGMGLKLAISTDSQAAVNLDFVRYGIDQARRGWLEPDDVINTRSWAALRKLLKRD
jgi:DNA polymerase (family 10)